MIKKENQIKYGYIKAVNFTLDIVMHSAHIEGKSIVAEMFIRALKIKIYRYMTSISKNVYIDKLDNVINNYSNT